MKQFTYVVIVLASTGIGFGLGRGNGGRTAAAAAVASPAAEEEAPQVIPANAIVQPPPAPRVKDPAPPAPPKPAPPALLPPPQVEREPAARMVGPDGVPIEWDGDAAE